MLGVIDHLVRDKGFGFIKSVDGQDWFFHRTDVLPDRHDFDRLTDGEQVDFEPTSTPKGRRATQVRRY